jgi:hypothetical protein
MYLGVLALQGHGSPNRPTEAWASQLFFPLHLSARNLVDCWAEHLLVLKDTGTFPEVSSGRQVVSSSLPKKAKSMLMW